MEVHTTPKSPSGQRKERIEELLKLIAGCEISVREFKLDEDWTTVKLLQKMQKDYVERLKNVSYGLPETRNPKPKSES